MGLTALYNSVVIEILEAGASAYDIKVLGGHLISEGREMMMLDLIGIQKSFGHPNLEVKPGIRKLKERGLKIASVDSKTVNKGVGMCCYEFCKNFRKRQRWPAIRNLFDLSSDLQNPIRGNYWPTKDIMKIGYETFGNIIFGQTLEFDYSDVTPDLLKDSALAPSRASWAANYDSCALRHLYGTRKPFHTQEERRTTIYYLKHGAPGDTRRKVMEADSGIHNVIVEKPRAQNRGRSMLRKTTIFYDMISVSRRPRYFVQMPALTYKINVINNRY